MDLDRVFNSFLEQHLRCAPSALAGWFGTAWVEANLHEWLNADRGCLEACASDVSGGPTNALAEPVAVAAAHDVYLNPGEPAPDDLRLIHVGDGEDCAFVELWSKADTLDLCWANVRHRSFDLHDAAGIGRLTQAAREAFAPRRLDRICVYVHGDASVSREAATLVASPGTEGYKRFLAASLKMLQATPAPPESERVALETPSDLSFYEPYSKAYDDFWAASPHLKAAVRKETPEFMEAVRRGGGVRCVWIDDRWAGVLAAQRAVEHGLRGWVMRERVLSSEIRGQGLGAAVLWRFIQSLPPGDGQDALWGHIAVSNRSSLRSALKLGRVDVGGTHWIMA